MVDAIDTALFVVCLDTLDVDTESADGASACASNMLHGTYEMSADGVQVGTLLNRWYDKLQLIVCANGSAVRAHVSAAAAVSHQCGGTPKP